MDFTTTQKQAIYGQGHRLLVSAAAGSGKTAVLVQRVLHYLTAQQGSIQRMIIMTFTEAAAAEMRMKIKKAVDEYLQENGGNDHLMRQSALIDSAEIGTIHSICMGLITRHFQSLDLDPRMRLLDEVDQDGMLQEQLDLLIEELYVNEDPGVKRFLECFSVGRDDSDLREMLTAGCEFLEDQPMPQDFIHRALCPYGQTEQGLFESFVEDGLYRYLDLQLQDLQAQARHYRDRVLRHPYMGTYPKLCAFVEQEATMLDHLPAILARRDYDAFRNALFELNYKRSAWKTWTEGDDNPVFKDEWNNLRKSFKDAVTAYRDVLAFTKDQELARLVEQRDLLKTYFDLCMELNRRLVALRRKNGWITYGDMEHLAVELLVEKYDPETDVVTPTPLAYQLRQDYDQIVIDEFQDTNRAQDLIFRALSQDETNLFMVGDLKQSIYRFRGAEPELFDQKRRTSVLYTQQELTQPTAVELNENFRSHPGVLAFCNQVFKGIMRPELGGVVYDQHEWLNAGQEFLEKEAVRAELHWLEPQEEESGKKMERMVQNARYAAQLIARAVREKQQVLLPKEKSRPVEYGDFAILLLSTSGSAGVFEKALREAGIPVTNRNEGDCFYELFEVQSILSYLLVLNNPYNDVALVSLLYGDYFRFTVGELAAMRHRYNPLYDDLKQAAQTDPKAKKAYETIEYYRGLAGDLYVYDLLHRIYQDSGIFGAYAARGENEKCANLEMLAEEARTFEQDGYRGLYAFVQHVRISSESTQSGARLKNQENSVQIMSIHKSKGLQFPICILGDCQKKFSRKDIEETVLLHPRYGAATEHPQPELFACCSSLAQQVLAHQITADGISEEARVLYVALTRAQSKVITLVNADAKRMSKWVGQGIAFGGCPPLWSLRTTDASFGKWLVTLLAGSAEGAELCRQLGYLPPQNASALYCTYVKGRVEEDTSARVGKTESHRPFDRAAFRARLDWQYPHLTAVGLPAKLSVSEIKGLREQDEDATPLLEATLQNTVPRFVQGDAPRGNEIGNALHQALQFCDFARLQTDPYEELDRLVTQGFILEKQRRLIPVQKLIRFTQSPCFTAMMQADRYYKEERFLFPMDAKELFGEGAEGEILIQGVLDCYWVRGDQAVIVDYKTDGVTDEQQLIQRYKTQMDLYQQALKRVRGLTVVRREIYSFSLEKTVVL